MNQQKKGFRSPKKPTRAEFNRQMSEERKAKIRAFFLEYQSVCERHKKQLDAFLSRSKKEIVALPRIIPHYKKETVTKNKYWFIIKHALTVATTTPWAKKRFIKAYEEVCKRHRVQFDFIISIEENGIMPKLNLINYVPKKVSTPEIKDWDEAKKENAKWDIEAENDRKALSEADFKKKWPDRPYVK